MGYRGLLDNRTAIAMEKNTQGSSNEDVGQNSSDSERRSGIELETVSGTLGQTSLSTHSDIRKRAELLLDKPERVSVTFDIYWREYSHEDNCLYFGSAYYVSEMRKGSLPNPKAKPPINELLGWVLDGVLPKCATTINILKWQDTIQYQATIWTWELQLTRKDVNHHRILERVTTPERFKTSKSTETKRLRWHMRKAKYLTKKLRIHLHKPLMEPSRTFERAQPYKATSNVNFRKLSDRKRLALRPSDI